MSAHGARDRATLIAVALIGAAFAIPTTWRTTDASAPAPLVVGAAAFVLSSLRNVIAISVMWYAERASVATWLGWGSEIALVAAGGIALVRVSRRAGWGDEHRLAAAGGLLLMYAWGAFAVARFTGRTDAVDLVGHGVFAVIAVVLLTWAATRVQVGERRRSA
ncbi:MAG TPA: hypothetical protein VFA00_01150 [Actinomycetota bacterium]|nr:hypothetical protein [Actinomycetota bacterium]